jgi:tryptophan 7-halogenase
LIPERVQSIAIVGGGSAAWLAAATLARRLKPEFCAIRVVDSPQAAAGAFSDVALPTFHRLNGLLGINEGDLLRQTRGTYRLGARFSDWGRKGDRYFHTFSPIGARLEAVPFHHYWMKLRGLGDTTGIEEYSIATAAAKMLKFAPPGPDRRSVSSLYSYGYHFDAGLLAGYLREYAQAHGVTRVDRDVVQVHLRGEDGFIDALQLDDGSRVRADLYIDCGGIEGPLLRQTAVAGHEDWRQWLPCDRAVSVACASTGNPPPYSECMARESGWAWSVPLQGRIDCGYAYSSHHVGDDEAAATLLSELPGEALAEPRRVRLAQGRPAKFWDKNRILLTGSILEPLESTGLHLVQTGITRLVTLFPVCRFSPGDIEEYNRLTIMEHERIRDFLILHFKATQRGDSPFWGECRDMDIPDTLQTKLELYRDSGRFAMFDEEHFGEDSWLSLLLGQNIEPQDYDPLADVLDVGEVRAALLHMRSLVRDAAGTLPDHSQFIGTHRAQSSA